MSIRNVATKLPPIKIPARIPRSKTDILKALSMTVGMDSTAPDYTFIDDPRLLPTNSYQRLAYRLSKESGLKAAKYFFEKYPECFHRDQSEPKIDAFTYKEIYDESMDLTEDDLIDAISSNQLINAQTAYQVITKKGIEISDATKVELIQLLLFFRNSEPPDPDIKSQSPENPSPIIEPGISLEIFHSIKDKNTLAYSSIIVGLIKNGMKERANFFAKEAMDKDIPLTVEAYNYLILYVRDKFRQRDRAWEAVLEYLQIMRSNNVSPNVETFNCVLFSLRGIGFMPQVGQSLARKVMNEMRHCKIEPSLYTYQLLLDIFCSGQDPNQRVLEDILLALDGKNIKMQTIKDSQFFVTAMRLCSKTFGNPGLAYKLHSIVTQHENFLLLDHNDSFKKDYYENFFMLLLRAEVLQNVMQVYDKYVPNTFVPSVQLLMETIDAINLYQAFEYVPQICSDFLMFDYYLKQNWVVDMLPRFCESSDASIKNEKIQNHLSDFVTSLINMMQERADRLAEKRDREPMDSRIYSYGLKIFLNAGHHQKAQKLVSKMYNERKNLTGRPIMEALIDFNDTLFANGGTTKSLKEAVTIACQFGDASVIEKALKICRQMNLPESFRSSLIEIANQYNITLHEEDSSPDSNDDSSKPK